MENDDERDGYEWVIERCHGAKGPCYFQEMGVTSYEHMLYV